MLNEFTWTKNEEGKEILDCHISITEEGKYEVRNHQDSSQSESFSSAEELGNAIATSLRERQNR